MKNRPPNSNPFWWAIARLKNLCRLRYSGTIFLPDDDAGRSMLVALLHFGLTDEEASAFGYWCEAELPTLKECRVNRDDIGKLIGLTTAELDTLGKRGPWCVGLPVDKTPKEFEAWMKERRNKTMAKAQQKQRVKLKGKQELKRLMNERNISKARAEPNKRHAAILEMLIKRGALSVSELERLALKTHAFLKASCLRTTWVKGPPRHAVVANLRDAIHETLNQLEARGVIVTYKVPGQRGPQRVAELGKQAEIESVGASGGPTVEKPNDCSVFRENATRHLTLKNTGRLLGERTDRLSPRTTAEPLQIDNIREDSSHINQEVCTRKEWSSPRLMTMPYTGVLRKLYLDEMADAA
jgi:hypothetical protein